MVLVILNFLISKESSSTGIPQVHHGLAIESMFFVLKMGKFCFLAPALIVIFFIEILDYQEFLEIFDEFSRWHFNKLIDLCFFKFPTETITRFIYFIRYNSWRYDLNTIFRHHRSKTSPIAEESISMSFSYWQQRVEYGLWLLMNLNLLQMVVVLKLLSRTSHLDSIHNTRMEMKIHK